MFRIPEVPERLGMIQTPMYASSLYMEFAVDMHNWFSKGGCNFRSKEWTIIEDQGEALCKALCYSQFPFSIRFHSD